jgi:hypothetical protein
MRVEAQLMGVVADNKLSAAHRACRGILSLTHSHTHTLAHSQHSLHSQHWFAEVACMEVRIDGQICKLSVEVVLRCERGEGRYQSRLPALADEATLLHLPCVEPQLAQDSPSVKVGGSFTCFFPSLPANGIRSSAFLFPSPSASDARAEPDSPTIKVPYCMKRT